MQPLVNVKLREPCSFNRTCAKFPSARQHNPINGANKTPAILKPVADRFPFNASSCLVFLLLNVSFISFSSSFPSFLINIDLLSLKLHFISEFLNNDYAFSVHLKLNVFIQIQSFGRFGNSLHNECRFPPPRSQLLLKHRHRQAYAMRICSVQVISAHFKYYTFMSTLFLSLFPKSIL